MKVNQVVWSSGRVVSSAMNILYAEIEDGIPPLLPFHFPDVNPIYIAQALVSDAWYSWTLQWWDQNGQSSASSTVLLSSHLFIS